MSIIPVGSTVVGVALRQCMLTVTECQQCSVLGVAFRQFSVVPECQ